MFAYRVKRTRRLLLSARERRARRLCEARGWDVIVVEEDIDVSGFSRGLDRPGLQRILTRLAELDVIVFFKIDRLARSTVDFAEIMRLAEHQGVALASATEPLDLTSSMGRAMAKVIAVFAELESDTIGMRVSSAHEHLRREGRWTGGRVPYGYKVADNPDGPGRVLVVNQDEAKTVHMIVERVLSKDSLMQIAVDLSKSESRPPATRRGRRTADGVTRSSGTQARSRTCSQTRSCSGRSSRTASRSCARTGSRSSRVRRSWTWTRGTRCRTS